MGARADMLRAALLAPVALTMAASADVKSGAAAQAAPSEPQARTARVYLDEKGDAVMRRTDDLSSPAPFIPPEVLPDILRLSLRGWAPDDPSTDPYTGATVAPTQTSIFRLDLVIDGLVNPPGPLGFGGAAFDPFRFGDKPLYGFIELDIDANPETGGDLPGYAESRYMGNIGRFNSVASGARAGRSSRWGWQNDQFFFSTPQIERSGAEFEISLCGCFDVTVVAEGGDDDGVFEAGETWIVESRFFRRSSGFVLASGAFGGSAFGEYDPVNRLRFSHDVDADETTVTLVAPLDQAGAALLLDEPQQPANLDVSDHSSIAEAMLDVIETLKFKNPPDPSATLAAGWAGADPHAFLDPTQWTATALVAATYATQRTEVYIYTDVGFNERPGDLDGDGRVTQQDRDEFISLLSAVDGSSNDDDALVNGEVVLDGFSANFGVGDLTQDGVVNSEDLALIIPDPPPCPPDLDGDGNVGSADLGLLLGSWGAASETADLDDDGVVGSTDLALLLGQWGLCPSS